MVIDFVLLTYGTSGNEGIDEGGKSRPPKVPFQESLGVESSCMSGSVGVVYGVNNGLLLMWRNVHAQFQTFQCPEY